MATPNVITINHPAGAADHQQPAFAATLAATIKNDYTILEPGILTGNMLINLTLDGELRVGAVLVWKQKATGTETTTFGTGITAPVVTGVAGKIHTQTFVFDGVAFVATSAEIQID